MSLLIAKRCQQFLDRQGLGLLLMLVFLFLVCVGVQGSFAYASGGVFVSEDNSSELNCNSYKGKVLAAKTLDQFLAKMSSKDFIKSEFETTEDYMSRIAKIGGGEVWVDYVWVPVNHKEVAYDADRRALSVRLSAITAGSTDYSKVFGSNSTQGLPLDINTSRIADNVQLLVQSPRVPVGRYEAETTAGAKFTVTRYRFDTKALLERRSSDFGENIIYPNWKVSDYYGHNAIVVEGIASDFAMMLKPTLKVAVVVAPKFPFYAKGVAPSDYAATFRPYVVEERLEVATVDFKCLLLADGKGYVLAAINTR